MLAVPVDIASEAPHRLVLLHGFTQSGRFWQSHAEGLADVAHVVAPDLPGHGDTGSEHDTCDLWRSATLAAEIGQRAVYAGYSMGARVALHLATAQPEAVEGLILVGAKGGLDDPVQRAYRRAADEVASERIEKEGVEPYVDEWLSQPFNARLPVEALRRDDRLRSRAAGLASSLRHCGTGSQDPLWDRLSAIDVPVLVVHGEHDMPHIIEDSVRLVDTIGPNARLAVVPRCGHSVPFECPDDFLRLVRDFMKRLP